MSYRGLRFAMVTTFYPPYHFGGDGQAVRRLAHALAERGHSVDVIYDVDAFRMLSNSSEPVPIEEPAGVRVHPLASRLGPLSCLATQQFGRPLIHGRMIRKILGQGFDVIHFHNVSLVGGPGILAYGDAIKLYTAHDHWLVCPSHVLWRHNRELCDGRQCLRCVLHYRRPPQLWRSGALLERQARHVDVFLTPSQFCVNKHREFGFNRSMSVIPPFLPDSEARGAHGARRAGSLDGPPYFLYVGRLEVIKGLQDVIPLFRNNGRTELWIAGTGNFELRLRALADGAHRVRFLGHQRPEDLRRLYRGAVAVVLPSICYEVFPMVVLEAFREGTPIVARDLGPFPEIIAQSNGGLLFSTTQDLATALAKLATNQNLRDTLGYSGAWALEAHWSEAVSMRRYFELIYRLARDRGMRAILDRIPDEYRVVAPAVP